MTGISLLVLAGLPVWRRIKYPRGKERIVDPLAEAEVYVAYGQRRMAIEVLEAAQAKFPQRADIAARLVELRDRTAASGR